MSNGSLVTAAEMRAIEADAAKRGDTGRVLMERAGSVFADYAAERLKERFAGNVRVLVLAGPGNNGGDALVVAARMAPFGHEVRCVTWNRSRDENAHLWRGLAGAGVHAEPLEDAGSLLTEVLGWGQVIIDGLLGTGIARDIGGELADVVRRCAESGLPSFAIDIPTGVDSDTGAVRGAVLPAELTVAFGALKFGHVLEPGKGLSGEILLGDIGLTEKEVAAHSGGELLSDKAVAKLLPARPQDANKGTFGKCMIAAGSVNYVGAAVLAVQGAMRSGAGLVTLACAGELMPIMATKLTESTFLLLPSDMGAIAQRAVDKLRDGLEGYKSLLVGCGIGRDRETAHFVRDLLGPPTAAEERRIGFTHLQPSSAAGRGEASGAALPPLVLDGDALNILSEWDGWQQAVPSGSVLTPHPGEMARLLGSTVDEVQSDRVGSARRAAADWSQIVVLKGAGTVIVDPEGHIFVSPFSNPALATAGTGDVLAGCIAGLLAQGAAPIDAACAGVYLHGLAGELLRGEFGDVGGLAGDLPPLLARARRSLTEHA